MKADRFAVALVLLASAGCATSSFDRHFEARRYAEAATAFDEDPSLHDEERALFRAGVAYALPESPVHRPERARDLLERLLDLHPGTAHRDEAMRLLALLAELERLEANAARRERELRRRELTLTAQVARLRRSAEWLEARVEAGEKQMEMCRAMTARLDRTLRDREGELRALREELDRLKAIDLRSAGPGSDPETTRQGDAGPTPVDSTSVGPGARR